MTDNLASDATSFKFSDHLISTETELKISQSLLVAPTSFSTKLVDTLGAKPIEEQRNERVEISISAIQTQTKQDGLTQVNLEEISTSSKSNDNDNGIFGHE
ncbi:hypothetical protein N7466_001463 [Penicillium verhagenii]|uniref:uncharacterized protein n=1 Tax=Penicillium verhagenii TaxID=1562060 RepID=UPI002545AEEC|nr:uncharacterized protein N7466_001463 [Penicillium verhagenii]KAJ5938329.1 hypothetical protein N7466_001463 [Penicillium verhagenii]